MTSTHPLGTLGSVASLLAATLYQGNHDRNDVFPFTIVLSILLLTAFMTPFGIFKLILPYGMRTFAAMRQSQNIRVSERFDN